MLKISSIEKVKATADTRPKKLTDAQRAQIVQRLAAYESPRAIAKAMKEELGIEIAPQTIAFYDPTRYSTSPSPKRWAELFKTLRAEIVMGTADIGAMHPMARVRWLDQMAHQQMEKGNTSEVRALLKQVADEMNRMIEQLKDRHEADFRKLSDAELKIRVDAIAARLGGRVAEAGEDGAPEEHQSPCESISG